jgi:hypothetical protein
VVWKVAFGKDLHFTNAAIDLAFTAIRFVQNACPMCGPVFCTPQMAQDAPLVV